MNSIGIAGFGLGLAIAAVGVLGLAVAFPPQSVPPEPVAAQLDDTVPDLSASDLSETDISDTDLAEAETPDADAPEADGAAPPALVLSDDADQPRSDAEQHAEDARPLAQPDMADASSPAIDDTSAVAAPDLAQDDPAALPQGADGAMRIGALPQMARPSAPPAPDAPAPAAHMPDLHDGTQAPADMANDAAPSAPQQDIPLAMLPATQGIGGAPRAPDTVQQPDAPPPAATDRTGTDALPQSGDDQPQDDTLPDGPDAPSAQDTGPETAPATPPEPDTSDPDASDRMDAPDGGTAMPGNRIAGMPGLPLTPRDAVPPLTATSGDDAPTAQPADTPVAATALERNAIAVDGAGATGALMAIVLHDPGLPMPLRRELAARDTMFTVALNPMDSSAADAAELYHQAGKEVLILANGIPAGATASDIDVTFSAYFDNVPLAAAVIDLPRNGFVRNTRLLSDIMQVITRDGYGLVTFAGGMGQAARSADAMGVPHAEVFRVLDAEDESPFTIRRFLDRAVFQASQVGYVIVFGEASNESTLDALDLWQSEGRVDQIDLVPVSAILLRQ